MMHDLSDHKYNKDLVQCRRCEHSFDRTKVPIDCPIDEKSHALYLKCRDEIPILVVKALYNRCKVYRQPEMGEQWYWLCGCDDKRHGDPTDTFFGGRYLG